MAADSAKFSGSADSYIGSFISLISMAEIRYEGFLFHISPQESTIGLRNVKSFGIEGRRKDGPYVLPSEKIYDYIFFRGSDIKDLQVISSPTVYTTTAVPNDPAIIQSHYPHSIPASASFQSDNAVPAATINSTSQLVHPNSKFHGNLPVNQPVGSLGSWGSWPPPPTANGNGIAVPTYWPRHIGPSGEDSHLQQQSLLQTSHGLLMSHPVQQLIQTPSTNASLPGNASNFSESPPPLLPTVGSGAQSLTSTKPPPSALPSSVPIEQLSTLPSKLSPSLMPNNASNILPTVTLVSNSPLASPLMVYSLDANPVVPPVMDKPKLVLDLVSPHQIIFQSMSSIVGSSTPVHSEASISSLHTPGQILEPGSTGDSSPHWQATHKDIEVVQTLTSESVSSDSESAKVLAHPLPLPSAEKLNGAALRPRHDSKCHVKGRGNVLNKTVLHTQNSDRDCARGKGKWLNGAALHSQPNYRGRSTGRVNWLNGAVLCSYQSNRGHSWSRENGPNAIFMRTHRSDRNHGWGEGTQVPPATTKFAEDFDFEAMNEKFNKEDIWGHLGKCNKTRLEDNEESDDYAHDTEEDDKDGLPNFDAKPVYVKDDFFDLLSCDSLNPETGRGRARLSEQRRIDIETFGEVPRRQHGHGRRRPSRGGYPRGSHRGSGYGYFGCHGYPRGSHRGRGHEHLGMGRGQTVRSRVT